MAFSDGLSAGYNFIRGIQQQRARKRAGIADIGEEGRDQQTFDIARARDAGIAAFSAYRDAAEHIRELYPDDLEAQTRANGEVFDQIMSMLPSLGASTEDIARSREMVVQRPELADFIVEGFERSAAGGSQARNDIIIDPATGQPTYVRPRDAVGEVAAMPSYSAERLEQGADRLDVARDTLRQREFENDPSTREETNRGEAAGTARGELGVALHGMEANLARIDERVASVLGNPALESIVGLPSLRKAQEGGLGFIGAAPDTPAADALADFNELVAETHAAALEFARDPRMTEQDRNVAAQAAANLERVRTVPGMIAAIQRFQADQHRIIAARRRAADTPVTGPSRPSNPGSSRPAPRARRPVRREGESNEQLLNRLLPERRQ